MAKVKRLRAESNGNRTFISDFVGTAEALAQTIDGLGITKDFVLTRVLTGVNTAVNLTISDRGGVIMRNKFFGVRGGDNLVVPKGIYLYAIGEYDTTEPRTTTTGSQYYQNYIYYLDTSDTPKTGLSTDYSALTGVWEIINGTKTSKMTISEYQKFYMSLAVMWNWDQIDMPLPNNSIGLDQMQDISVSTRKIADGAVTTFKVADGAITAPKLSLNAVTSRSLDVEAVDYSSFKKGTIPKPNLTVTSVTAVSGRLAPFLGTLIWLEPDINEDYLTEITLPVPASSPTIMAPLQLEIIANDNVTAYTLTLQINSQTDQLKTYTMPPNSKAIHIKCYAINNIWRILACKAI